MKNYVCLYAVEYYNDCDQKNEADYGLLYVDSFCDAMHQLEECIYGDDLVKVTYIELYENCAIFSQEIFEMLKKYMEESC